ncbi:MAG: lasso peptide biosynthesis B2 protein [Gemmatimonadales bacterium]
MSDLSFAWRLRATCAALLIPPLLSILSFAKVAHWLSVNPARHADVTDMHLAHYVRSILARLSGPWSNTCLRRNTVLYYLLRRAGRDVELEIGVARDAKGRIEAHAWLVKGGVPFLREDSDAPSRFQHIARFPGGARESVKC